jgi:hypothetical protein
LYFKRRQVMKRVLICFSVVVMAWPGNRVMAQTVEKSSGVVKMTMKKKEEETRASEFSAPTSIRMQKKTAVEEPAGTGEFSWITPVQSTVRTSESTYQVKATVNSFENISFVNVFVNGEFVKNIMPPANNIKQMVIDEPMELSVGPNQMDFTAVTVSGKKIESKLIIDYDISIATYYALVIAVQDYDDPEINDLKQPIKDATRFIDIISSQYNFDRENIDFMKNPTRADIIGKLLQMRNRVTPEDNLLIYYAGHGWWDEEMKTGYWFPKDASRDNPVDWLPNTDLTNYLSVLKTKHTLLISDACFSGGIFESRAAFNNVRSVEKLYKVPSRKAMTSGALNEVPDESVFIEYLIKRLAENNKKYLPGVELYSSMREAVENNSKNEPQYGTIQGVGDEGGDFIFIRRN